MFLFLVILCFVLAFITLGTAVYILLCIIHTNSFMEKHKGEENNALEFTSLRSKFNIPLNITLKMAYIEVLKITLKNKTKIIKKFINRMKIVCLILLIGLITDSLYLFGLANTMYSINLTATSVASAMTILLSKSDGCTCYVQCTGDPSLDSKCSYEILFGPEKYKELVKCAKLDDYELQKLGLDDLIDTNNRYVETLSIDETKLTLKLSNQSNIILNNYALQKIGRSLSNEPYTLVLSADTINTEDIEEAISDSTEDIISDSTEDIISDSTEDIISDSTETDTTTEYVPDTPVENEQVNNESTQTSYQSSGEMQGRILIEHMNEYMVNEYKNQLKDMKDLRKGDKKDRSKMSDEELEKDLIYLLSDYKVNGKNPKCECSEYTGKLLKNKCLGHKHYKEPWTWEDVFNLGFGGGSDWDGSISGSGTSLGHATGQYAITLEDGLSYYWYHQSSCTCVHNVNHPQYGRYSELMLGAPTKTGSANTASFRGCSTYSTAIALSNILGMEITPYNILTDVLDGTIQGSSNNYYFVSDGSTGIKLTTEPVSMNKAVLTSRIQSLYGSYGLHAEHITVKNNQAKVDEILSKGGVIVFSITNPGWPWYSSSYPSSHFITLRKKEGDLYYHLNSTAPRSTPGNTSDEKCMNVMNTGVPWEILNEHINNTDGCAYWIEGGQAGGNGQGGGNIDGGSVVTDSEVLSKLQNSPYRSKATTLAAAYSIIAPEYGHDAAVGVMANIWHEGSPGLVQYGKTVPNWNGPGQDATSTNGNPLYVRTAANVNAVEGLGNNKNNKIGVGMIQWTYYSYMPILANYYRQYCGAEPYSNSDLLNAELHYLLEMANSASSKNVMSGNYREVCEKWLMNVEKPQNASSKIEERCSTADGIYNALK